MKLNQETGWFDGVRVLKSPHFNARPNNDISMIVVHSISLPPGQFSGHYIDDFFLGKLSADEHPYFQKIVEMKVSAHLLINRQGEVTQYVSFNDRAWHAGQSVWQERENCNDFSIGIELEGIEDMLYTAAQYDCLVDVVRLLKTHYPAITQDNIVRHSDIAPDRKSDPGPTFKWDDFVDRCFPPDKGG